MKKRRLKGDFITIFQYSKVAKRRLSFFKRASLFTRHHTEKMRGNFYKLLQGRVLPDTRGNFFTKTISHWNNLPRKVIYSLGLGTF